MNIEEWELLYSKNSHTIVQELLFPSQKVEEEVLSLESNIKQKILTPVQLSFQATEVEQYDEVVEEDAVGEHDQFSKYEKQSEEDEEIYDEQTTAFESTADITSDGKSESISFTEEDEEVGEMVEYTPPVSNERSGGNKFRLRTLLKSAGLAVTTFSIFILQKSMPKNQNIQCKIHKNELQKAKQLFQQQQQVAEPLAATTHSSFTGHYDEWY